MRFDRVCPPWSTSANAYFNVVEAAAAVEAVTAAVAAAVAASKLARELSATRTPNA